MSETLTEASAIERHYRGLKKHGHKWLTTTQDRESEDDCVPQDRLVWASCTCGWMAGRSFRTKIEARDAQRAHAREKAA